MKQYLSIFRIRLLRGLQYRTAALAFIMLWFRDPELISIITRGDTAYELTRPIDLYAYWYARLVGQRLAAAALRFLPILAVAFFLPEPYGMRPPASPAAAALFIITLGLGLFVVVGSSMTIYILTAATLSPQAAFLLIGPIGEFCDGLVIPLPMMSDPLRSVLELLPFRLSVDRPLRAYSGLIGPMEALQGIGLQVFWIAVLVIGGWAALMAVIRRSSFTGA